MPIKTVGRQERQKGDKHRPAHACRRIHRSAPRAAARRWRRRRRGRPVGAAAGCGPPPFARDPLSRAIRRPPILEPSVRTRRIGSSPGSRPTRWAPGLVGVPNGPGARLLPRRRRAPLPGERGQRALTVFDGNGLGRPVACRRGNANCHESCTAPGLTNLLAFELEILQIKYWQHLTSR